MGDGASAVGTQRDSSYPFVHHATASRVVKGEDVLFVHPLAIPTQPQSMMYMVCDGHSGVEAANFVASNFLRIFNTKFPTKLPNFGVAKAEVKAFAESVRKVLCETFVRLDNEWANVGHMAGTTVSVALCIGWLLTVANTGDSAIVLDTGCSILELTRSHRIQSNLDEQTRLKAAGQQLAPLGFHLQVGQDQAQGRGTQQQPAGNQAKPGEPGVGPIRLWPGGLCVSRAVGDLDAGPEVVPIPHIRQIILPVEGCRVVMASDGLWDVLSFTKAIKLTRSKPTGAAASTLVSAVSRDLRTMDDASIVIIDILPSEGTSFPTVALKATPQASQKAMASSGLFSCFKAEPVEPDSRDLTGPGHLGFYCDVDCLRAYPGRHPMQPVSPKQVKDCAQLVMPWCSVARRGRAEWTREEGVEGRKGRKGRREDKGGHM
ncbi:PPM-type phosphatase domain-containing protein [Haematococcus lacustris]|uniref:PPM-type phosphatase domain-containing protein n=1 Tax=Haematococcus lacustris TaxID=44745 RepID=A0A6A0A7M5_HAELA|nr:PPM-type phosphatase domain-containing protein [Haematococcus lacustris]